MCTENCMYNIQKENIIFQIRKKMPSSGKRTFFLLQPHRETVLHFECSAYVNFFFIVNKENISV